MWTPLSRASRLDGVPQLRGSWGHWPWRLSRRSHRTRHEAPRYRARRHLDDDRVIHTGFAALDAILGPGGLPESASVAIRGDGSSGRTTLSLRLAAEAQAQGSVVAWLDLVAQLRPGRGGRPRRPARMARRHHPGQPRRGPRDRGLAPRRALGRPARARPARRPAGDRPTSRPRSPTGSIDSPRSPVERRPCSCPRSARARGRPRDRRRGVERPPPRARPPVVDPARARHRRPADGGAGRAQSLWPAGAAGDAPDPLRGRRRTRRLPPPGRPPPRGDPHRRPGPRHRDSNGPTAMRLLHLYRPHLPLELAMARASEPFPPGPLVLGGRPWDPGTVIDANPDARALGVRRGIPLASAHRLAPEAVFVDPDPDADRAAAEAAFEALAAFSPGLAGSDRSGRRGLRAVRGPDRRPRAVVGSRTGPHRAADRRARPRASRAVPGPRSVPGSPARASRDHRRGPCPRRIARSSSRPVARPRSSPRIRPGCSARTPMSGPGSTGSACAGSAPWRSSPGPRWWPGSGEEGARLHARARGEETDPFRPRRTPERLALHLPIEPPSEELESLRFVLHRLAGALTGPAAGARPGRDPGATCASSWTSRSPAPGRRPS